MDDGAGLIFGLLAIAAVIAFIVFVIVPLLIIFMGVGALCGGGYAVYNYASAFRQNVRPERV
ncbi:MAG: hypothetical protein KAW12_05560 [Candidatus Aminicenantes bacterium]|nr:hypothetical protein [Candidatus Aminicenantes bacterium]